MNEQLTLGEFIKKLEDQPQDNAIQFDFMYFVPDGIDSYRGYYDQLALGYKEGGDPDKMPKVKEILNLCKDAIGKYFTGYKGGNYLMTEKTPIWVSNYREVGDTGIIDVIEAGWRTIIVTGFIH
jgi:hypothetical protein